MKKNCWEYMKCGREIGGINSDRLGVCPASTHNKLDGVHGGINAGRACWMVAGTFCKDDIQGTFAVKYDGCSKCEFFKLVLKEEGRNYQMTAVLLNLLKGI
jgi:hypothetical protein